MNSSRARQRARALIALLLGAFVVLIFAITIAKMAKIGDQPRKRNGRTALSWR